MTKLRNSGGTALNTHSYLYNQGHQRYRQTRTDSSYATYTYDNIGQLKSAIGTGGESTENLGYAYDAAWNLNTRTNYGTSQTFQVNVKNELTNAVGFASSYDANGNLTNRVYDAMSGAKFTALVGVKYSTFAAWLQQRRRRGEAHSARKPRQRRRCSGWRRWSRSRSLREGQVPRASAGTAREGSSSKHGMDEFVKSASDPILN
jgi:hypothetical protein